jgi:hypothetical protein
MTDFTDKLTALISKPPKTNAEVATYLTSYKTILDDANTKVSKIHMKIGENKKIIDAFKTFLTSSSTSVSAAQRSLAAGNLSATNSELLKAKQSEYTFTSAVSDSQEALSKELDKVNPADQFQAFEAQLNKLAQEVK